MGLYSFRQMFQIEEKIFSDSGLSPEILMEHAGFSMARRIEELCRERSLSSAAVLCGCGHNGGDGFVIARALLSGGLTVRLFAEEGEEKPLTALNRRRCERQGLYAGKLSDFAPSPRTAVVDALFGIGLNRPLAETWRPLFERIRKISPLVIAADTPSGVFDGRRPSDPILPADFTLTVERRKTDFYTPANRNGCGFIETVSAAFPADAFPPPAAALGELPSVRPFSPFEFKNSKGHIALHAGCAAYPGAAVTAARAAFKTGAGLVTLFTDSETARAVLSEEPSVILADGAPLPTPQKFSVWACGCGWGRSENRLPVLKAFIETPMPRVLDADGLNLTAEFFPGARFADGAVLTPHPGEWKRLCPGSARFYDGLLGFAAEKNAVVVYKSSFTAVASPRGDLTVFDSPVPELGTAGSGDVLAGITAASLLRRKDPYAAAVEAVAVHNEAGKKSAVRGPFTAADLIESAAAVFAAAQGERHERNL